MTVRLEVLGTSIAFQSNDPRWIHFMEALWEPFLTSSATPEPMQVTVRHSGAGWLAELFDQQTQENDPFILADMIRYSIAEQSLREAIDVVPLHAAALQRNGQSLLLAGASRSGKTTIALVLVARGWVLMSDDLAPISLSSGDVLPFPRPLGLRSLEMWRSLVRYWDPPFEPVAPRSSLLAPAWVIGEPARLPAPPRWLVFLNLQPEVTASTTVLGAAETIARSGQFAREIDPDRLAFLVQLCGGMARAELTFSEPEDAANAIEAWLMENC